MDPESVPDDPATTTSTRGLWALNRCRSRARHFATTMQGSRPYRQEYMKNSKQYVERVRVEWDIPTIEWGTATLLERLEENKTVALPASGCPQLID
jgi:hypothetical protein